MTELDILSLINTGGVVATLVLVLVLFVRGQVVPVNTITLLVRETVRAVFEELRRDGISFVSGKAQQNSPFTVE